MVKKRITRPTGFQQASLFDAQAFSPQPAPRCAEGLHSWKASASSDVMICVFCGADIPAVSHSSRLKRID